MSSVVLTGFVSLACSVPGQQPDVQLACSRSIEAGARQSGIYDMVATKEQSIAKDVEMYFRGNYTEGTVNTLGATFLVVGIAAGQRTFIRLGKGPFEGQYYVETSRNENRLGVGWDF